MSTLQKLQTMTVKDFEDMTPEEIELFNLNLQIEKLERLGHDATELIKQKKELEDKIEPDIEIKWYGTYFDDDIVILN